MKQERLLPPAGFHPAMELAGLNLMLVILVIYLAQVGIFFPPFLVAADLDMAQIYKLNPQLHLKIQSMAQS